MSLALVEAIAPPVEANAAKKNKDPKRIKYTLSQRNKRHIRKIQELQEEFHDQNIPSISAVVFDGKIHIKGSAALGHLAHDGSSIRQIIEAVIGSKKKK